MVKNNILFLGIVLFALMVSISFSSAWLLNGTVYDTTGAVLNNSNITITSMYAIGGSQPGFYDENTTQSNANGLFSVLIPDNSSRMYKISLIHRNAVTNAVDYVGQTLPYFPYQEMSRNMTNVNFYMKPAGTINITAINSSGGRASFNYQIKDTTLGYNIDSQWTSQVSEANIYVPIDRNYSIMIYPSQSMPLTYNWNNFSSEISYNFGAEYPTVNLSRYNVTTRVVHKQFNTTMSTVRVTGFINGSLGGMNFSFLGGDGRMWEELTIVPYLLEPGNMIFISDSGYGTMPYNMSAWIVDADRQSDSYNLTTGAFNITLPGPAEPQNLMLFASGKNTTNFPRYFGSYRNLTVSYGSAPSINFTMYGMLGETLSNISMMNASGQSFNDVKKVVTRKQAFNFINKSNNASIDLNMEAHMEIQVDYTNFGGRMFTFMAESSSTGFYVPLLNITGFKKINVFTQEYSPKSVSEKTVSEIREVNGNNISLSNFNPQTIGETAQRSQIFIGMTISNSSCNIPYPVANCYLANPDNMNMQSFNPLSSIIGGGKINFIMGMGGVRIVYINVDMLASGPPDALFEDNSNVNETRTSGFAKIMRFGGNGPKMYDYVLVSMPYTEGNATSIGGIDEGKDINIKVPVLYDENWNVMWNVTTNVSNSSLLSANYSHYSGKEAAWQTLMDGKTCIRSDITAEALLNETNPCYVNITGNKIWLRLPHFSGTGPEVSGQGYSENYVTLNGTIYLNGTDGNVTFGTTYLNRNYIIINVTANVTGFSNITVYLYNVTRDSLNLTTFNSTYSTLLVNFSNLADGLWFFNASAFNASSVVNSTSTWNVTIDTILPIVNFTVNYTNNTIYNGNSLFFNVTSRDANFKNLTIRLYDAGLTLINSSSNTTSRLALTNHSFNFTDLIDIYDLYYYDAIAYDLAENSNTSSLTQVILNLTSPILNGSLTASPSTTTANVAYQANKTVNVTVRYGISTALGLNSSSSNYSLTGVVSLSSLTASTTYYYNITICDRAGNCLTNGTNSFTTSASSSNSSDSPSSSSGSTLDGWYVTYSAPSITALASGYNIDLMNKNRVAVKVGNETHHVGVVGLNQTSQKVTINVSSTPQQAIFGIGDEKKFDVTEDNYYDFKILLKNITGLKANLIITSIHEQMPVIPSNDNNVNATGDLGTGNSEDTSEEKTQIWTWIVVIICVLVIILIGILLIKRRNRRLYLGL